MKSLLLAFILLVSAACATRTKETDGLVKGHPSLPHAAHLTDVVHIEQEDYHCGPATMAMVLSHAGKVTSPRDLAASMMVKNLKGTFQMDMLLAARQAGMQTIELKGLEQVLTEVSQGHPVIVFQNLGLTSLPQWHYSVVTGFDLSGPDIFLHTGDKKNQKTDMRLFERSWILGGNWALLVLPTDQLSATGNELDHVHALSFLEQRKNFDAASTGYKSILHKWPQSLSAHIGLGNVHYQQGDKIRSMSYLKRAVGYHPESDIAWHNLAIVQGELGQLAAARLSSIKALTLSSVETRAQFEKSLKDLL
jgi:predicted Zn-dependent protease